MAQQTFVAVDQPRQHRLPSGAAVMWASLAGIVVGGPLLGMMGFTLMASLTLLLVFSPLLLVSSPLLVSAGVVLAAAMAGFASAAAMAFAGVSVLAWVVRGVRWRTGEGGSVMETLTETGKRVKERGVDLGDYLERNVQVQPPEQRANQV